MSYLNENCKRILLDLESCKYPIESPEEDFKDCKHLLDLGLVNGREMEHNSFSCLRLTKQGKDVIKQIIRK